MEVTCTREQEYKEINPPNETCHKTPCSEVGLTSQHREAQKKHEEGSGDHEHPHEEHLRVEALVELDDLHGLVEDGVEVEVALGVPAVDVKESENQTRV